MSLQIIEELKKCFNCNSLIRIPKVLPCGQSICSNCSGTLSAFFCTYCRKEHILNDLVVNQAHYRFLELINKLSSSMTTEGLPEQRQNVTSARNDAVYDNDNSSSNKIAYLNNEFKYQISNLACFLRYRPIRKQIKVLNHNLVLLVTEVFHGKINTTYLQLISNNKIINETEINNHLVYFFACCANQKYILVVFSNGKKKFDFRLFDLDLNLIVQKDFFFEINKIIMNETNIYVLSDHEKTCIIEYGFELVKLAKFGQNKNPKRSFYIQGNVINVTPDKIFTKHESCINVLSKGKGEVLIKFNVDDLKSSCVFLDKMSNFLVYNGFSKLSLYNSTGELVIANKIRYPEQFEEFQLTQSGHFAFVNNSKNFILIL
ncbi:hypothetical protein BpHYR1_008929 [Brachionus plicatilis]|uniref:Uncharacterized protein n=1 Tax=Brachionus plicatilis TaxID=10195 RepID=A0A3M7RKU4_BRAPC|nr:hypothetical protein BpHYR1_008929 [Brachionus plicatilis]